MTIGQKWGALVLTKFTFPESICLCVCLTQFNTTFLKMCVCVCLWVCGVRVHVRLAVAGGRSIGDSEWLLLLMSPSSTYASSRLSTRLMRSGGNRRSASNPQAGPRRQGQKMTHRTIKSSMDGDRVKWLPSSTRGYTPSVERVTDGLNLDNCFLTT